LPGMVERALHSQITPARCNVCETGANEFAIVKRVPVVTDRDGMNAKSARSVSELWPVSARNGSMRTEIAL
jgi:hypothetical protein